MSPESMSRESISRESEPDLSRSRCARRISAPTARRRQFPRVLGWMHIALFTVFSCLAPGTMPEVRAGGLTVVICTGAGLTSVTLDENGQPLEVAHAPCEWSVPVQTADIVTSRPAPTVGTFAEFKPEATKSFAPTRQDKADQNRPRGPPHIL